MATPVRPPHDITPARFFEEWLPGQVAGARSAGAPLTVRVELSGTGGGAWDLHLADSLKVGRAAAATAPDVSLAQSVADWRAIIVGEPGAVNLAPPQASATDLLFLDRGAQVIRQIKGTLRFEVTDYNGRTWSLGLRLGAQAPAFDQPSATVSVDAATYAAILARTLPAPQAFFSGKIKITGDVNLAMQLSMAMMAPRAS